MLCNKCGGENPNGSKFCAYCGANLQEAPANNNNTGINNNNSGNFNSIGGFHMGNMDSNIGGTLVKCFNGVKEIQNLFFVTVVLSIFNIIMTFFDMVEISFFGVGDSGTFRKLFSELGDYYDDAKTASVFITICTIISIVAIVSMLIPLLSDKMYNKKYLLLNLVAMVMNFILYIVLISLSSEEGVDATATAYIYLVETAVSAVATFALMKKLKTANQPQLFSNVQ